MFCCWFPFFGEETNFCRRKLYEKLFCRIEHHTHLPNEDLCIQNEQAKRGFNLCLWMYDNAEKLIFEILPHSIFYYSQYRQYIWADLVALALLFGLPSKILCGRISKMSFLHYPNIHKHGLMPLLSCTFCICQAPFSRRV